MEERREGGIEGGLLIGKSPWHASRSRGRFWSGRRSEGLLLKRQALVGSFEACEKVLGEARAIWARELAVTVASGDLQARAPGESGDKMCTRSVGRLQSRAQSVRYRRLWRCGEIYTMF